MQANHISRLLESWYPRRDQCQWVLGSVYKIEGPSYRKPGAMMLFNSDGQQFGLLSGGCLESDIQNHARRVMASQKAVTLCYDGTDEDDISFSLGIGCGGIVHILLQPLSADVDYLGLEQVRQYLQQRQSCEFHQLVTTDGSVAWGVTDPQDITGITKISQGGSGKLIEKAGDEWLITRVTPRPHVLVVGGGVDARPLVAMGVELGWDISLCDTRPASARREHFPNATAILRCRPEALVEQPAFHQFDAAVVMNHNLELDAAALAALNTRKLGYLALLGPKARRDKVLGLAGLSLDALTTPISAPAGFDLGGELPESIALSILAECHACLAGRRGY